MSKFEKGNIPWNTGLPKEKQPGFGNKNMLGEKHTDEAKEKISKARKGSNHTEETKKKISEFHKGNKYSLGNIHSEETKKKMSESHIGEKAYNWNPNREEILASANRVHSTEYKQWRIEVYKRDNYKCKIDNKDCDGRIEAHHILNWIDYSELRYNTNNGITLCKTHHPRGREKEKSFVKKLKELIKQSL